VTQRAFIICAPSMGFPEGMAATARVRMYASALRDSDYRVLVVCPAPSERELATARNTQTRGTAEGIDFWYSSGSTVRASGFLRRRWAAAASWVRILLALFRQRPCAVLAYPMTPTVALLVLPVTRVIRARLLCDQSELLEVHAGAGILRGIRLATRRWGLRHADVVVAITPSIAEAVGQLVGPERVLYVPVLIDAEDFGRAQVPSDAHDVVYAGPLNDRKDGVGNLLEAFAIAASDHHDARLVLVGDSDAQRIDEYSSRAAELGVEDSVVFRGTASRPQLLETLATAAVLVLPRPDTPQNQANMPTKLVEYMASGRPIVATKVGFVPSMVVDGAEATLVEPWDVEALASSVSALLADPAGAAAMGERARLRAVTEYDYRSYIRVLDGLACGGSARRHD
jgi:glycosyltransferase involved in cell wall biosynthesis